MGRRPSPHHCPCGETDPAKYVARRKKECKRCHAERLGRAYHRRRQAEGKSSKPRGKPYKARRSAEEITEEKRLAKVFGLSVWQYRKAKAEI